MMVVRKLPGRCHFAVCELLGVKVILAKCSPSRAANHSYSSVYHSSAYHSSSITHHLALII